MKTLAIIPARGGSKGIKNKNLASLFGKPLLYYTINAAKNTKCIDKIVLSSDSEEILKYGRLENIDVLKRPDELSRDESTSNEVITHALKEYSGYENVILLQPTSPFRTYLHIDEAFKKFIREKADALISVIHCDNKILKAFICDENKNLKGIANNEYPFMPRQKLPLTYLSNGAIYIIKTDLFLQNHSFLQKRTSYYVMSEDDSIDIDSQDDLQRANNIMESSQHLSPHLGG